MASEAAQDFPRLQETVTDGRLANVFFRREQLFRLQDGLRRNEDEILDGIVKDSGNTPAEALAELYMTASTLKFLHDQLKPNQELELEYRVANAQDATAARVGVGIVVIVPQRHTFVYSVLAPLCSAIAAGNCVAVVLEQTLHSLPAVISKLLRESLDPGIFEVVSTKIQSSNTSHTYVVQDGKDIDVGKTNVFYSPSESLAVAVVDRTSNIEEAAKTIINARMAFNGTSPYAPDIVLVNEFAKTDFVRAVLKHSIEHLTEEKGEKNARPRPNGAKRGSEKWIEALEQKGLKIITSGSNGAIVEVEDRTALAKLGKTRQKSLYILEVRSLEDAMEVTDSLVSGSAVATYAFGDWKTCKYLLQFIDADAGFANLIPTELLVGPIAPRGHGLDLSIRYPPTLFSVPRPMYAEKDAMSSQLEQILDGNNRNLSLAASKLWEKLDLEKRAKVKHDLGYFERGIVLGAVTFASPVLLGLGTAFYFGVRKIISMYSSKVL